MSQKTGQAIRHIAKKGKVIAKLREELEAKSSPMAIVFCDLCGSTELKAKMGQADWLPIICEFLMQVATIVKRHNGIVLKYIGDEVMAVFPDDPNHLVAHRVEGFLHDCESELGKRGSACVAKYALDFGMAAPIGDRASVRDYLGVCVDRCARIAKFAKANTAVASESFVRQAKDKSHWKSLGFFRLKGIREQVQVYQLASLGERIKIDIVTRQGLSIAEMLTKLRACENKLIRCRAELQRLRSHI